MNLEKQGIRVLGSKNPKAIRVPHNNAVPRMIFGNTVIEIRTNTGWRTYFGFGRVVKICKSDDFDLVFVDFGGGKDKNFRLYFSSVNSRKQVYTLKVGQYAQFGMMRRTEDAKKNNNLFIVLWAMGIYVPKMVDIRNTELTEDEITTMTDEDYGDGKTFLDMFEKND